MMMVGTYKKITSAALLAVAYLLLFSSPASAACSSPAGAVGNMGYFTAENVYKYCDDTNWIEVGSASNGVTNGLVGWWKLDGNGTDSIGGTTATTSGSPTYVSGVSSQGLSTASGEYLQALTGSSTVADFGTNDFSVCFWMQSNGSSAAFGTPIGKWTAGASGNYLGWGFSYWSSTQLRLNLPSGVPTTGEYVYFTADTTGRFHHICLLRNSGTITVWFNGTQVVTHANANSLSSSANFRMGSWGGLVDDVRIYNRALSSGEIAKLASANDPCHPNKSPAAGVVCNDGTVYAGISPDGNIPMYTTRCDRGETWNGSACTGGSSGLAWNNGNSTGRTDISTSTTDGDGNTATLVASDSDSITGGTQPHLAAQYCNDLVADGYTDWYLPARNELQVLCSNSVAIGNFNRPNPSYYAASSQLDINNNYVRSFYNNNCTSGSNTKNSSWGIRCVRKGYINDCTSPYGRTGTVNYNTTTHRHEYCNGSAWIPMDTQCANNNGGAGCTGGTAGSMRYNTTGNNYEYCEGDAWVCAGNKCDHTPNGVNLDSTDYLSRATTLTGVTDSTQWTGAFWHKKGNLGMTEILDTDAGAAGDITVITNFDSLNIAAQNAAASTIFNVTVQSTAFNDNAWHHIMWSIDLTNTSKRHIMIDGTVLAEGTGSGQANFTTYTNDTMDFTPAGAGGYAVGSNTTFTVPYVGDLADFWVDFGTYINLSNAENRRKFYNSGPMYLGCDGSAPTGTAPDIFLSGATASWETNDGTGGNFTETGTLTDAATDP